MAYKGNNHKGGRPVGSISTATAIAQKLRKDMAKMLEARWGPIMQAQLDAAQGIVLQKEGKDGPVYQYPGPSVQAFKQIQDQVMGKPKESVEVTGKDGGPMMIKLNE